MIESVLAQKVVRRTFFARSPLLVAPDLLGKILVRRLRNTIISGRIVEVEAYLGYADPAAHSFTGRTKRNSALFEQPGTVYVHAIHRYNCLDVVTEAVEVPTSVLIRALEPLTGIEYMQYKRQKTELSDLTSGPGKLCQALQIDRSCNGLDLTKKMSRIWIADDGFQPKHVQATPRIGISKAVEMPYRFVAT